MLTVGAVFVFRTLEREFVPPDDRGFFFTFVIAPEGSTLAYTDGYLRQVEAILAQDAGDRELLQRGRTSATASSRGHHLHAS